MSKAEEQVNKLLVEHRLIEGSIQILQSRIEIVNSALTDIQLANTTLEGLRGKNSGLDTLVPIGAGSFVRFSLTDSDKIIMGVGAGVCVEKKIDDTILELKSRQAELERARASLQDRLTKTVGELEERRKRLSELIQRQPGESGVVVR